MFLVRHSFRALLVALGPIAFLQGALIALALAGTLTRPPIITMPSANGILIALAAALTLNGGLLFAFHLCLRNSLVVGRAAYALTGAAAGACSYAIMWSNGWLLSPPAQGAEIAGGVLPFFAGAIAGFLYQQLAGLEPVVAAPRAEPFEHEPDPEPFRFEGPVRVRTSIAAVFMAAIVPSGIIAMVAFSGFMLLGMDVLEPASDRGASLIVAVALPAQLFLMTLVVTILPAALFVLLAHLAVRALGRSSGLAYSGMGAAFGAAFALLFGPFSPLTSMWFLFAPAVVCGAIMGALYRRFAGLEALPLPEPLIINDEQALVGADHPARRGHAVIVN